MAITEILREFSSEIIASCALVFTAWQFSIQRKHNRVSVTPHLFSFRDRKRNVDSATITVSLMNNGLGPAFIHKFEVYLDGKVSDPDAAVKAVFGEPDGHFKYTVLGDDFALAPGQEVVLITVPFPIETGSDIKEMERELDRLEVVITYKSAYGTKYVLGGNEG
ncbi:hypothetical protein [Vibrio parahaemolyticus]|uniref:hypothetical protein n=1 Tax=Vibrio parahaemolyticus TaxID=670 RepID=UPI0022872C28|nr:hypothetical protein [Vibrio parahaemolyticus]MCZ0749689.1 hypothetical protein [Vibrio parahaemolyticus]